jgi:hypothetical protein
MSRRNHHVSRHHGRPHRPVERRPGAPSRLAPAAPDESVEVVRAEPFEAAAVLEATAASDEATAAPGELAPVLDEPTAAPAEAATAIDGPGVDVAPAIAAIDDAPAFDSQPASAPEVPGPTNGAAFHPSNGEAHGHDGLAGTCTTPQLRRFIKSRAYVPMHELRRRFAINGSEDDVTQVDVDAHRIYVGLPEREGRMLGELLRGGDVGFELSLDPITPIVVGVYPMRPVPRP